MNIFSQAIVVQDDEGFDKQDIFGRRRFGDGLTHLLTTADDPLVIAVDGQWGSGKSVFLKMWAGDLRKKNIPVIYFDAFENDYIDDAFTSIASEIIALAKEKLAKEASKWEYFYEKTKIVSKILLRSSLKLGVKAATLGVLDGADIDALADSTKDIAGETSQLFDKLIGERLTKAKEEKEAIAAFKEALSLLPHLLVESGEQKDDGADSRLIIIIDELDRCKPTFALEIMERMKHFFSVPNVHFVLGVNMEQLCNSVQYAYGTNQGASLVYLEKFINTVLLLSREEKRNDRSDINQYCDHKFSSMKIINRIDDVFARDCLFYIKIIARENNFSFRKIDKIFQQLALVMAFSGDDHFRISPIVSGLCIMKVAFPALYQKARLGQLQHREVLSVFGLNVIDLYQREFFIEWWEYCCDSNISEKIKEKYRGGIRGQLISDRLEIIPYISLNIIDALKPIR